MPRERTFIMIKPDGVQRGLVSKIIARFEEKGFKLVGAASSPPCGCPRLRWRGARVTRVMVARGRLPPALP